MLSVMTACWFLLMEMTVSMFREGEFGRITCKVGSYVDGGFISVDILPFVSHRVEDWTQRCKETNPASCDEILETINIYITQHSTVSPFCSEKTPKTRTATVNTSQWGTTRLENRWRRRRCNLILIEILSVHSNGSEVWWMLILNGLNRQTGSGIKSGGSREALISVCKGFIDFCSLWCPLLVLSIVTHLRTHGCDSATVANT